VSYPPLIAFLIRLNLSLGYNSRHAILDRGRPIKIFRALGMNSLGQLIGCPQFGMTRLSTKAKAKFLRPAQPG